MKKIGIIPLRAGSKGIPGKNKKKILGKPLFTWVLGEAIFSELDEIYVYTDDKYIIDYIQKEYTWSNKVRVMERSANSATDIASTESAMIEFSQNIKHNYDIICLLQATSPLTNRFDINKCIEKIEKEKYDSSLTVVKTKRFIWDDNGNSTNYNYKNRPRRQDFTGVNIENGAVYATTKEQFLNSGIRIGENISVVEMPEDTLIEIDELSDWLIVEKLLENRIRNSKKGVKKCKAIFLDVDGVFTNGNVVNNSEGEFSKEFSMRDGMGLEIAKENGIEIFVITSEYSKIVSTRMNKLNIKNVYLGVKDKYSRIEKILSENNLKRNEIAYVGDDINDLANICSVSWGITPNNGLEIVKEKSDVILNNTGGDKAIREAINFVINYNKKI